MCQSPPVYNILYVQIDISSFLYTVVFVFSSLYTVYTHTHIHTHTHTQTVPKDRDRTFLTIYTHYTHVNTNNDIKTILLYFIIVNNMHKKSESRFRFYGQHFFRIKNKKEFRRKSYQNKHIFY